MHSWYTPIVERLFEICLQSVIESSRLLVITEDSEVLVTPRSPSHPLSDAPTLLNHPLTPKA